MANLVMRHEITKSYIAFKAIYVPTEYLGNFPDVDQQFIITVDNAHYDVALDSCHRIKLTDWFNEHGIKEDDIIELYKEGHKKYKLKHKRKSNERNKSATIASATKKSMPKISAGSMSKRQVELAAVEYVKRWLRSQGIEVRDASSEGCDLITVSDDIHYIEVKGSRYSKSPIMIYESIFIFLEKKNINPNKYFIYIVSDIESDPKLRIITPEMQKWQEKKIRVLEGQSFNDAKPISLPEFKLDELIEYSRFTRADSVI